MAVRFLSATRKYPDLCRLTPSSSTRSVVGLLSTAAEQRSAGDHCHGDDGDDDHSAVTHIRMLEHRARKLEEQVHDLTERYKRALADTDNVRRRTQKFVEDAKLFGIQSFCRDIVEVADLLEKSAAVKDGGDGAQNLTQDLSQINRRLQDVFTKHGLEKMKPVGGSYDPYQHEVVCHTPAEGVEPGTVALVKQDGYMLHGRTIRHALVGIAMKTQEH